MEKFEGFTEEEIKSLNLQKDGKVTGAAVYKKLTRYKNRLPRNNVARERLLKGIISSTTDNIPKQARLNIPQVVEEEEEDDEVDESKIEKSEKIAEAQAIIKQEQVNDQKHESHTSKGTKEVEVNRSSIRRVLNSDADINSLDEFETRRKLIEEQNRQRKELLKKALADRTKKTREEVHRLNEIEGELKKLDQLLSNDVAIIRNQIESSSIEFMEAQKRYDHAEKEFLDAKLDLFNKKERKELLTSHLCTIIEQNELRKAKKLSDLMMQLEIGGKTSLLSSQIQVEYKSKRPEENNKDDTNVNKKENSELSNVPS